MTSEIKCGRFVYQVQGVDRNGREFGYVSGEGGGLFFTWMPTLEETLDSMEQDEVDGDGGLDFLQVEEMLREYLPATAKGRKMWAAAEAVEVIRYSQDGSVCMVWRDGEPVRCPTQDDMDTLPVGEDMTDDESESVE